MNRKFFVLAFVSAAFFFGCSADGPLSSPPSGGLPPAVAPGSGGGGGGGGGGSVCVVSIMGMGMCYNGMDTNSCNAAGGTLSNSCPNGYPEY